jgi:predicted nucleotidyltransferase
MSADARIDDAIRALRSAGAAFALVFGSRSRGDHRDDSGLDIGARWANDAPAAWDVAVTSSRLPVVDDGIVLAASARLVEFEEFVTRVSSWLAAQHG